MELHVPAGVMEAGRGILPVNVSTQTVEAGPRDDKGSCRLDSLTVPEEGDSRMDYSGLGICISHKLPGDAPLRTTGLAHLPQVTSYALKASTPAFTLHSHLCDKHCI